ncbi:MAG TPA: glycosyltransferase family 4 protein [Verrucomicrobiae bacterium]|nr:glycosyltransferase family 4 protein [Verrucomicrobiae bacterium]
MNVLVWNSWVAPPVGGMERIALEIALQLHSRKHTVVLVGAYDKAPELRVKIPADMPYYFFDLYRSRIKPHLAAGRLLGRVIRDHKIEIVSAHGSVFASHQVCRRRGIPHVWTIHGAEARPNSLLGRMKTAALARVLYDPLSHAVAVSTATAEIIHQQFPRLDAAHLHVINNGAPHEASLLKLPLPHAGPPWQLGFIGRLAERKRPLDLVEVARKLDKRLDFKLHVFGEGPLEKPLKAAIARHHLENRFVMHGYWDKGSAGMLEQIQVLVHTDSVEPFGGALVEAQLSGRPVVAYRVGGNPDIVENGATGCLVPLGDINAFADGVHAIAEKSFADFSVAARERAIKCFSLAHMADQYVALFERVCAKN